MRELISDALQRQFGFSDRKRRYAGVCHTAIWKTLQELDVITYIAEGRIFERKPLEADPIEIVNDFIGVWPLDEQDLRTPDRLSFICGEENLGPIPSEEQFPLTPFQIIENALRKHAPHVFETADKAIPSIWRTANLELAPKEESLESNIQHLVSLIDDVENLSIIVVQQQPSTPERSCWAVCSAMAGDMREEDLLIVLYNNLDGSWFETSVNSETPYQVFMEGLSSHPFDVRARLDADEPILSKTQRRKENRKAQRRIGRCLQSS